MSSYQDLIAWQKAMALAEQVYRLTSDFPERERYGLTSQMRRSAVSIPSNIAEGHGRLTTKDWQRFLAEARGSSQELETQLMLSVRLGYLSPERGRQALDDAGEVGRIINGLLRSTANRVKRKPFQATSHD